MSAARQQRKTTMATIGTFTAAQNGYGGSVKTRSLFRPKRTTTRRPTIGPSMATSNAAPPGRRPRGTAIANISR